MEYDTRLCAEFAGNKLDRLINRAHRDTVELVELADVPSIVKHFAMLRAEYQALKDKVEKLEAEVNDLSYNIIPTVFANQNVKTIKLDGVGRVTVNVRWVASMVDKTKGMDWLRSSGNEGLIIETVNSSTLSAFAKASAIEGKPLPDHLFTVGTSNHTSITKS